MSRHIAIAFAAVAVATILVTGAGAGSNSAPGQQAPVNLTPPSISGTTQVGSSLTAAVGRWDGNGLKYGYQWMRCDSGGASCSAIGGATSSTTSLSSADLSATLRVVVTATNRNGSAAATSAATAAIASAPAVQPPLPPLPPPPPTITSPSVTSPPTITGTSQQGQTLTASTGSWNGTLPMTYSYQWQRCDSAGASCASVAGAIAGSYLLASADVGATIRVSLTATNAAGSATASSSATNAVSALPSGGGGVFVQRLGSTWSYLTHPDSFDQITVSRGTCAQAVAATSKATVLPYTSAITVRQIYPSNVDYNTALANGWLLKDANGNYLHNISIGSTSFIADIGNAAYQQALVENVLSVVATCGADGTYFDDVLGDVKDLTGGIYPSKYPDKASWRAAMVSGMVHIGQALKARGLYVMANAFEAPANDASYIAQFWRDIAPGLSGIQSEYWIQEHHPEMGAGLQFTDMRQVGPLWYQQWDSFLSLVKVAQDAGLDFHALIYGDRGSDYQSAIDARATMMLIWDCTRSGGIAFNPNDSSDPYQNGAWETNIGCPIAAKQQVAPNVWKRAYSGGAVYVNATGSAVSVEGRIIPAATGLIIPS